MSELILGDSTWREGQRVMWLTRFKRAIDRAMIKPVVNSKKALDVLLPKIVDGGNAVIKAYESRRTPIQAEK